MNHNRVIRLTISANGEVAEFHGVQALEISRSLRDAAAGHIKAQFDRTEDIDGPLYTALIRVGKSEVITASLRTGMPWETDEVARLRLRYHREKAADLLIQEEIRSAQEAIQELQQKLKNLSSF